tara:strand:- start:131 stop:292 length:162 start_codon:yes stop_codon:yes gene_type:complete
MNNELAKDILQMIEHAQNNVDNGGSFSQYVKLIEGIKNLCIAAKNKQILNKNG